MSILFNPPKFPKPPKISDKEIDEEKRRILANQKSGGRQGTILTGGRGDPSSILGSAASLQGGSL